MKSTYVYCLAAGIFLTVLAPVQPDTGTLPEQVKNGAAREPKTRTIHFTYEATLTKLKPGTSARIWLPRPVNSPHQKVTIAAKQFPTGAVVKQTKEQRYGNQFFYIAAKAGANGNIRCTVTYRVQRWEVRHGVPVKPEVINKLFFAANKMVPLKGKPSKTLLEGKKLASDHFALAKQLYQIVNEHMKYNKPKGKPWGRGDAVWACDNKYGNCTDFHSLFISLARTKEIPAKFEIGFPLPPKRGVGKIGGYHCWAWFLPAGKGWTPVDISEANRHPNKARYYFGNLTENRILFTTGRDLVLEPKQDGPPLNFFIYPYAEVDGKAYTNITRSFQFKDVK